MDSSLVITASHLRTATRICHPAQCEFTLSTSDRVTQTVSLSEFPLCVAPLSALDAALLSVSPPGVELCYGTVAEVDVQLGSA